MKLLVEEDEILQASVTIKSKLSIIDDIKNYLSKDDLLTFRSGCFGHFLDMDNTAASSGQLLHFIKNRRIKTKQSREFWFDIFGRPARFSITEFALMTGLRCGELPTTPSKLFECSALHYMYFSGLDKITVGDLKDRLSIMEDGLDKVMIAMVYFLNGVLLSKEYKSSIRLDTLSFASHFDQFNAFPWGRVSYDMTFDSFDKKLKDRVQEHEYTLTGFPWAIQFWAYEAFPAIGAEFATRLKDTYPRMLNWKCVDKRMLYDSIDRAFRKLKSFDTTLKATEVELAQIYMHDMDYSEHAPRLDSITNTKMKSRNDRESSAPKAERAAVETEKEKVVEEAEQQDESGHHHQPDVSVEQFEAALAAVETRFQKRIDEAISRVVDVVQDAVRTLDMSIQRKIEQSVEAAIKPLMERFHCDRPASEGRQGTQGVLKDPVQKMYSRRPPNKTNKRPHEEYDSERPRKSPFGVVIIDDDEFGETKVFRFRVLLPNDTTIKLKIRDPHNEMSIKEFIDMVKKEYDTVVNQRKSLESKRRINWKYEDLHFTDAHANKIRVEVNFCNFTPNKWHFLWLHDGSAEPEAYEKGPEDIQLAKVVQVKTSAESTNPRLESTSKVPEVMHGTSPPQSSNELEDDLLNTGMTMFDHERKLERLNLSRSHIQQQISDLQATTGCILANGSSTCSKESILKQLESKPHSAAAIMGRTLEEIPFALWPRDVVGVVALLGTVQSIKLSRMLSQYIGEDQMLTIVCKDYAAANYLEAVTLPKLATEFGHSTYGGYHALCLEDIRPQFRKPSSDPQQLLPLEMPTSPNGNLVEGFLGYAVNLISIEDNHLQWRSKSGHGLRETLFYRLFGGLQVYKDRECMMMAQSCIEDGAVSLDGGLVRGNGLVSLGHWNPDILFPVINKASLQNLELLEAKKLELIKINKSIDEAYNSRARAREKFLTSQEKYNYTSQNRSSPTAGS